MDKIRDGLRKKGNEAIRRDEEQKRDEALKGL
jgi:hypothetical protein